MIYCIGATQRIRGIIFYNNIICVWNLFQSFFGPGWIRLNSGAHNQLQLLIIPLNMGGWPNKRK